MSKPSSRSATVVFVLGSHRAGTSLITRSLGAISIDLGLNLLPADANNPTGYFEDLDVLQINNEILSSLGAEWYSTQSLALDQLGPFSARAFRKRAIQLLKKRARSHTLFAVKDPRIARLPGFWADAAKAAGLNVQYVIAFRPAADVVRSLTTRDGISEDHALLIWLRHMLPALTCALHGTHIAVPYDAMVSEPSGQLDRLSKHFGLKTVEADKRNFEENFVSDQLQRSSGADLRSVSPSLREIALETEDALLRLIDTPSHADWALASSTAARLAEQLDEQSREMQRIERASIKQAGLDPANRKPGSPLDHLRRAVRSFPTLYLAAVWLKRAANSATLKR